MLEGKYYVLVTFFNIFFQCWSGPEWVIVRVMRRVIQTKRTVENEERSKHSLLGHMSPVVQYILYLL